MNFHHEIDYQINLLEQENKYLKKENEKLRKVVEAAMNFKKRVDHSESRQFAADFGEYKHLEQALKDLDENDNGWMLVSKGRLELEGEK